MLHVTSPANSTSFSYDLVRGHLSWRHNGVDIFQRGPEVSISRALTQNDVGFGGDEHEWNRYLVGMIKSEVRGTHWQGQGNAVWVQSSIRLAPPALDWSLNISREALNWKSKAARRMLLIIIVQGLSKSHPIASMLDMPNLTF